MTILYILRVNEARFFTFSAVKVDSGVASSISGGGGGGGGDIFIYSCSAQLISLF